MPRTGIEAEASSWEDRRLQANFAFADGRVLNGAGRGPAPSAIGPDGRATVIGAGALTFRCIEPFRRWSVTFDGPALDGHVSEQIDGRFKTKKPTPTQVRLEAEMTMVTPAWVQEVSGDIANMTKEEAANAQAMGLGYRFEHHFRATGHVGHRRPDASTSKAPARASTARAFVGSRGSPAIVGCPRCSRMAAPSAAWPIHRSPARSDYSYNDAVIYQNGRMIRSAHPQGPVSATHRRPGR